MDVGVKQKSCVTGPRDSQQIWPWSQHETPQQSWDGVHAMPEQPGVTQWPAMHASFCTSHLVLQSPQCCGSF